MALTTFNLIWDFEGALVIKKIKIKKTDKISLSLFVRIFQAERKKTVNEKVVAELLFSRQA